MKKYPVILLFLLVAIMLTALAGCSEAYKLSFSQEEYMIIPGIEFVPEIKIKPKKQSYEITSSNITIAKPIDNNTIITLREGKVTLTVSSGKKTDKCTLYISEDNEYDSNNVKFAETVNINFVITNYELASLPTEKYGAPLTVIKNGYAVFSNDPYIKGYYVHHWFKDRECTLKFNPDTDSVDGNITLYAFLEEMEVSYIVTNNLIVGLTYDNLPHQVLYLPEKTENGSLIEGIADNAFKGDEQIITVNIPHTYKTIGESAFAGCKNLKEVNFMGGESQMQVIGTNAFGVTLDKLGAEKDSCLSLEKFVISDTVDEIGAYAFYKCEKLSINGIPSRLNTIPQYCFAYTKINNADFENVTKILEGAFYKCASLENVYNTDNVTRCYQYAFDDTLLYKKGENGYLYSNPRDESKAVIYAGTIAVGAPSKYGTAYGTGDLRLKPECTLIADKAFYGSELTELTLYIDTPKAAEVFASREYDFIGYDIFAVSLGTKIAVPKTSVEEYKAKYTDYKDIICHEITINVESNINMGTHRVLVFNRDGIDKYHYHKYSGKAEIIDLGILGSFPSPYYIRISTTAFSNTDKLREIKLGNVERIAPLAITAGCKILTAIDLSACASVPILENASSFQIGELKDCYIYINGPKSAYENQWAGKTTAINRLKLISEKP